LAVVRRFPWREVIPYVAVHLAGALLGAVLIGMLGDKQRIAA
jgi:glycerol uptake facilitator-like aquaporin